MSMLCKFVILLLGYISWDLIHGGYKNIAFFFFLTMRWKQCPSKNNYSKFCDGILYITWMNWNRSYMSKEIFKEQVKGTCLILFTYSFNMTIYCFWILLYFNKNIKMYQYTWEWYQLQDSRYVLNNCLWGRRKGGK